MNAVLPLFEEVQGLVNRNAIDPSVETAIAFERFQNAISLDEGLLHEVVGVFVVGGHVIDRRVNTPLVTPDQLIISNNILTLSALH